METKKRSLNKKIRLLMLGVLVVVLFAVVFALNMGGGRTKPQANSSADVPVQSRDSNILIVYFAEAENSEVDMISSASVTVVDKVAKGRIRALADMIAEATGGDLFSIQTSTKYPGDGRKLVEYAQEEQDKDARPELTTHIKNLEQYDTVFVGYPTWWYDLPQVLYSFFDEYDLSGKTIVPFNSANGSRFSGTIGTIQELEPDAKVIENGLSVDEGDVAGAQTQVNDWLKELGYQ